MYRKILTTLLVVALALGSVYPQSKRGSVSKDSGTPVAGASYWGPVFQFVAPVDADFAWINQDSATITDLGGSLALNAPAAGGPSLHIRKKSAPATPYTIEIAFIPNQFNVSFQSVGFCWRQSSDGKLANISLLNDGQVSSDKWDSPTSFSASYIAVANTVSPNIVWFRAIDNGTNRTASYSLDGVNWLQFHSVGRTDYLTADEVGFYVRSQNATYNSAITLLHWKQY